jgi:hypothetical protein
MVFVVLLLMVSAGLSMTAQAQRKTDVITLYNGDRITGEIKALSGGRLSLSTDAMGTLTIEWKEIASVESNYNYELRLADGSRLFGSVKPGSVPGSVTLQDIFGEHSYDWEEVIELRAIEDTALDRLEVYVSANYSFTKASGVSQTELRANISYEDEDALNSLNSRFTVSDTDSEATTSSRVALSRRVWTDRQALYRQIFGGYESNDELGLDYRMTLGGGLGRYIIESNSQILNGGFGVQALEEKSVGGDTQASLEGVLTIGYNRWRFDSPELDLKLDSTLYPSLTERGRIRADANATLRWEVVNDLYWDFSAWGAYDNSAVEASAGEFDWGVTTGVGWDF